MSPSPPRPLFRAAPRVEAPALASLPRRLAALALDYLRIALYIGALSAIGLAAGRRLPLDAVFADPLRAQLLTSALLTLPVLLYFAVWEASARQATPGKRALRLRVVSTNGGRLPLRRSLVRSALKFAPWELAHSCLWRIPGWPGAVETIPSGVIAGFALVWLLVALYLLMPLLHRTHQTPYDRAAGSVVVRAPNQDAPR